MNKIWITNLLMISLNSLAQSDSIKNPISISGYLEVYYGYDFSKPEDHNRPWFVYSHNRHNEINLNLGFIKASYTTERVRGNVALMTGTYANANLAEEPAVLRNIFEANIGVKIAKTKNLWVDAGVFQSHIGFESAIGKDCWTLTRSIMADNSPYFETGAKISYTAENEKWFLSGLILNGWQRIQRLPGNNTPSFGHQLTFKPNPKILLNSSSFIGSNTPDSTRKMRYFHNLYSQLQLTNKLGMTIGFDIGFQQESKGSTNYYSWYAPIVILQYALMDKVLIEARSEYYKDINGVIIASGTLNGFQTFGYSLNVDYQIFENLVWRMEGRNLTSKDKIFYLQNEPSRFNYLLTTALALAFQKGLWII
jgi:hypothetical protein